MSIEKTPDFAQDHGVVKMIYKAAASADIAVQRVRENIAVLSGSGANITVFHGRNGKLLVDAGMAVSLQKIGNALDKLGGGSIDLLVNTHWHFDHTDGNEWVHAAGAAIIAHENTRKHMSTETRVDDWNFTFPPSPDGALPSRLVSNADALDFNGTRILIEYYGPAHTDGDLSVTFEEFDVMNVGDTWWNGSYPFIDYSTGGSIGGTIEATERNIAKGSDDTVFIPGHGPPGDLDQVIEYRDMLITVRDRVAALKKQGESLDNIILAKPTNGFDQQWGCFLITPEMFVRLVWAGV